MNRTVELILILTALFFAFAAYAQNERYVILIDGDKVYVDMGYMDGVREGMRFEIYRVVNGLRVSVARCEVEETYDYASKLKVIGKAKDERIRIGDMAEVIPIRETAMVIPQAKPKGESEGEISGVSGPTRWWVYGGGLLFAAAALYFNHSANVQYDKYASARNPDEISRYRDAYNREITKARVSAVLAGAVVVGYLMISVTVEGEGEPKMAVRIGGVRWFGAR
ncbi:TPA: hypothetical protein EYP37_00055 [Candidatus Poribacteria bacterium]|nr:hypothetical protein [Candidatus Poribacteria bacterium]